MTKILLKRINEVLQESVLSFCLFNTFVNDSGRKIYGFADEIH